MGMRFTLNRWLESFWKKFKFHDYAQKAKDLLECPLNQSFPLSDGDGESMKFEPLNSTSSSVEVVAKVKWAGIYTESTCKPYMDMACNAVVRKKVWKTDDCAPWFARPRNCFKANCTFQVEARYLDQCGSWVQEWCQQRIDRYNHVQNMKDHAQSLKGFGV